MSKLNIVRQYLDYHNEYCKLYGEQTLVFMQVGSFHECYSLGEKEGPDLDKISQETNCIVTRKNNKKKSSDTTITISNPFMLGVPSHSLEKHMNRLIEKNYTIVVIDQVTPPPNPKRKLTGIYSKGTQFDNTANTNYIMNIYMEEVKDYKSKKPLLHIGMSIMDISTGQLFIHDSESNLFDSYLAMDECVKLLHYFNPQEVILNLKLTHMKKELVYSYCDLYKYNLVDNTFFDPQFTKLHYQEQLFKDTWNIESQLSSIEELHLVRYPIVCISLSILLSFIKEHNQHMLENINKPIFYTKQQYLNLGNDAIYQLDLVHPTHSQKIKKVSYKSLFDVINHTYTSMGKRYLYYQILHPLVCKTRLQQRYNKIETILQEGLDLSPLLKKLYDIEKLNRKLSLKTIEPKDLYKLYFSLCKSAELFKKCKCLISNPQKMIQKTDEFIKECKSYYNLKKLETCTSLQQVQTSFYNTNVHPDIDTLYKKIETTKQQFTSIQRRWNETLCQLHNKANTFIRLEYNDRLHYHFEITKKRFDMLMKQGTEHIRQELKAYTIHKIKKGASYKLTSTKTDQWSFSISKQEHKLQKLCQQYFHEDITILYSRYHEHLKHTISVCSELDFIHSGAITAKRWNYSKPKIQKSDKSFIKVKQLRHPIVERIIEYEYVPHDICLGTKTAGDGILLYGLNSSGKSTIMKAIGLNVILAQIGYYTSSSEFTFSPYEHLFCRISSNDNLFRGLSSFHLELNELDSILNRFNENTLILADEVCKGTEPMSALIIVATLIDLLSEKKSSFISATHLHELVKLPEIKQLSNVNCFHLTVRYDYKQKTLIYDRILKRGSGPSEYGLEVASFLMKNTFFIQKAKLLKRNILNLKKVKKSRYNKKVIMKQCAVCGHKPKRNEIPLETHHILPQKDTDELGFCLAKPYIHKNNQSNLTNLCFKCHDKIDNGTLVIKGYKRTSKGNKLDVYVPS